MGMPRFTRGAPASAAALNMMATAIDYQGLACKVRRSSPANLNTLTDYIVPWAVEDYDTFGGGMWDPAAPNYVLIRQPGSYLIKAQVRFGAFSSGECAVKILINTTNVFSTDPVAGPKTSDKRQFSTSGEGVTLGGITPEPLQAGDRVYISVWHSSSTSPLQALYQDFGGTYLSVQHTSTLD